MSAKPRARGSLSVLSSAYIVGVGLLFRHVPLRTFNVLLAAAVVPLVWLIWAFARWSALQHARRWAQAIERVHSPRRRRPQRDEAGAR